MNVIRLLLLWNQQIHPLHPLLHPPSFLVHGVQNPFFCERLLSSNPNSNFACEKLRTWIGSARSSTSNLLLLRLFTQLLRVACTLSLSLSQLVCVCGGGCLDEWSITSCSSSFNPKPWRVNPNTRTWIEPTFLDISVFWDCLSFLLFSPSLTKIKCCTSFVFVDSWSLCLL